MDKIKIYQKELGKIIHNHRKVFGYTQQELAEYSNLSTKHISELERGKSLASSDTIFKIQAVLKLDLNQMEVNPLSASATLLWYTLMQVNNQAGLKKQFTVSAPVLRVKSGLKPSSFKRAREELRDKGLIQFHSLGRNQATLYEMKLISNLINNESDITHCSTNDLMDQMLSNSRSTDEVIRQSSSAIQFYESNFGASSHYITQELYAWTNKLGDTLVMEAMKSALEHNKFNWSYVKSILLAWESSRLVQVNNLHDKDQFRKTHYPRREEGIIPEWFYENQLQKV
ncbi:DnaD domain protein [Aquibacillus rhizosphaerae]|uniref:DnaD domain protein n=1 Tax=Aquibacillus rhizosphaerae TaxID=3051431 RepID=A0ABT7L3D1_9BACI|nr:DnaD domain protein [Aquibacillus sp. LR5S19]MDL4839106.1 DnaD domain protein [Aquibacillus sp. LR5S19]